MGWGFRKSFKIAPGVRVNLSKNGLSTSIGGKGLTYNTRGRVTFSIPGTGIRHTVNINKYTKRQAGIAPSLSARTQANTDFAGNLDSRLSDAVVKYFWSHGIYVSECEAVNALAKIEDSALSSDLQPYLKEINLAFQLYEDTGNLTAQSKERSMQALYALEERLSLAHGKVTGIGEAVRALEYAHSLVPQKKPWQAIMLTFPIVLVFGPPILAALIQSSSGETIVPSIVLWSGWSVYRSWKFFKQRNEAAAAIAKANAQFDAVVIKKLSFRPTFP